MSQNNPSFVQCDHWTGLEDWIGGFILTVATLFNFSLLSWNGGVES